ncbi:MAG: polysaccharide deacetylase family protein [Candidatus Aminicenantes bacterium]|nr:MAG: polysaccharide deacetylase family protein [Candidatus Aminicenantes bacterium]
MFSDKFSTLIATYILFSSAAAFCAQSAVTNRITQFAQRSIRTCAFEHGGIIRGLTSEKKIALIFTGGDYAEGGNLIRRVLSRKKIKANFFFTGNFYRNSSNRSLISKLVADGHYLGPHSDKHLLYCSWENRDRLLVNKQEFVSDIRNNYGEMEKFGITKRDAAYFVPPYEWYNEKIVGWAKEIGLILINFSPGTGSNADYTTPSMPEYKPSEKIYKSIIEYEKKDPDGLNGFLLLLHIGTHPDREDKFYHRLDELIDYLISLGYGFSRVDDLLTDCVSMG